MSDEDASRSCLCCGNEATENFDYCWKCIHHGCKSNMVRCK